METKLVDFDGVGFIVPAELEEFPYETFEEFGPYCGAGHGIGNIIIPEKLWGLKISPCCFIHDMCWRVAEATWADFYQSNALFLMNMSLTIKGKPSYWRVINMLRTYAAATYYNAVSFIGAPIFWAMKAKQELVRLK